MSISYSPLHIDDERGRLAALRRYEILDSGDEQDFDEIVALVHRIFGVPIAAITLIDEDRMWIKASVGLEVREVPRRDALCDFTIRSNETLVSGDAAQDPRFCMNPFVTGTTAVRSYMGVPLTTPDGYNVGALCVMGQEARSFGRAEREMLESFARIVVTQFELRQLARSDALTGALSRVAFESLLADAVAAARTAGRRATLALIDIDHFKSINDAFGHPVGDLVLTRLARAVRAALRGSDGFGRLGGEEFGILMPDTDIVQAQRIAERVRAAISALVLPELRGRAVTASIGLAEIELPAEGVEYWIANADVALYEAKHQGRNRVMLAA
ncbi:MAG: sensor domain-containing diguanylate cyclase [Paracoccaceae bacterium]|nr:MAG: sensor domain-containing diguanylate cyclase [Paracoccaceae bacterium]